jgi:hypothetical protein
MNDDELTTAVMTTVADVHMTTPTEHIVRRSRVIRTRRRIPGLAAAMAAATAAVLAVTALLPGHHSASHQPGIQLTAWTVVKRADGTVYVRINQLRNPAGLQRKLRADGVPASVIFGNPAGGQPGPCQSYGGDPELLSKVVTPSMAPGQPRGHAIVMTIHPSALPTGAGVQIITNLSNVGFHLVRTSQGCTGS